MNDGDAPEILTLGLVVGAGIAGSLFMRFPSIILDLIGRSLLRVEAIFVLFFLSGITLFVLGF